MKFLVELKNKVSAISHDLNAHTGKLSMLVEGGIRSVVLLENGEPWFKSVTLRSAADVIAFIQEALGETAARQDRALVALTDLLRAPVRYLFLSSRIVSTQADCTANIGQCD